MPERKRFVITKIIAIAAIKNCFYLSLQWRAPLTAIIDCKASGTTLQAGVEKT
jgi:hypothetical protein